MATKIVTKQDDRTKRLEESAAALLELLDERERFLIEQTCEGQQLSRWMYVVGILKRALDTGEHTLPTVDPLWRSWTDTPGLRIIPEQTCPVCHKTFTPRWRGQLYDCNECGSSATRTKRLADADVPVARAPVGEEPPEMLKSTIGTVPAYDEAVRDAQQALESAVAERASSGGLEKTPEVETTGQ